MREHINKVKNNDKVQDQDGNSSKPLLGEVDCLKCKVYNVCKFIHLWKEIDYKHERVFEGSNYNAFLRRRKIDGCDYFS